MATTTNYTWDLPTVGGDEDTWGTKLNGNWTALDTLLGGVNATEFAILDGATVTTDELNLLDGVTATTAEINTLDGITATVTELNLLDGITALTGADTEIVTGTAGTDGQLAQWNADGDVVGVDIDTQSQATWEAGTDTTESLVSPAKVKAAVEALAPFPDPSFAGESGPNFPSTGSLTTIAHGLGVTPKFFMAYAVCVTSNNGYVAGVKVRLPQYVYINEGSIVWADATNVYIRQASTGVNILNTSGTQLALEGSSNWKLRVEAWA